MGIGCNYDDEFDYDDYKMITYQLEKKLKEYEEFFKELKHIAKSENYTGLEKGWAIEELFDEWEKKNA